MPKSRICIVEGCGKPVHPQVGKPKNVRRKKYPTAGEVRAQLHYNPCTGEFRWKARPATTVMNRRHNKWHEGQVAGTTVHGYVDIGIGRAQYRAHRLAWIWWYGYDPDFEIDHINKVRSDNRITNLRLADYNLQASNKGTYKNNKSGFRGVSYYKSSGKWVAQIKRDGKMHHLGYFANKIEAAKAYDAAAKKFTASPSRSG